MATTILPTNKTLIPTIAVGKGGIAAQLELNGSLPPVSLIITPVDSTTIADSFRWELLRV